MELHTAIIGLLLFAGFSLGLIGLANSMDAIPAGVSFDYVDSVTGVTNDVVTRTDAVSAQVSDSGSWFSGGIETIQLATGLIPWISSIIDGVILMLFYGIGLPVSTATFFGSIIKGILTILICFGILKAVFKW